MQDRLRIIGSGLTKQALRLLAGAVLIADEHPGRERNDRRPGVRPERCAPIHVEAHDGPEQTFTCGLLEILDRLTATSHPPRKGHHQPIELGHDRCQRLPISVFLKPLDQRSDLGFVLLRVLVHQPTGCSGRHRRVSGWTMRRGARSSAVMRNRTRPVRIRSARHRRRQSRPRVVRFQPGQDGHMASQWECAAPLLERTGSLPSPANANPGSRSDKPVAVRCPVT